MKLLLVDDEIVSAEAILSGVDWRKCGVDKTIYATSVAGAKKLFQEEKPDILLLDIEMSGESGLDFLSWVRELEGQKTPCIILTCHPSFFFAQQAIRLEVFDYLLKPIEYEKIEHTLYKLVQSLHIVETDIRLQKYGEQWIAQKVEAAEEKQKKPLDGRALVEKTAAYIQANLGNKILIEDLAEEVHLNPDYLNRLFKRYKDMSINKYVIRERMELAGYLLKEKKLSATAVALEVGYPNYANFSNMFKKYYDMTPGEYCKKVGKR